jgi:hypothetical protein
VDLKRIDTLGLPRDVQKGKERLAESSRVGFKVAQVVVGDVENWVIEFDEGPALTSVEG